MGSAGFMHMRYLTMAILVLFAGGCAPRIVASNPNMVIIDPIMMYQSKNKIMELANTECGRYNRKALYLPRRSSATKNLGWPIRTSQTGGSRADNTMINPRLKFSCVQKEESGSSPALEWPEISPDIP